MQRYVIKHKKESVVRLRLSPRRRRSSAERSAGGVLQVRGGAVLFVAARRSAGQVGGCRWAEVLRSAWLLGRAQNRGGAAEVRSSPELSSASSPRQYNQELSSLYFSISL